MAEPASTPRLDNPAVSHEKSDVDLRRITYLGAGLAVTVVVILGLLLWLFDYFNERELRHGRTPQEPARSAPETREPRLQISPPTDLAEMRAAEDKVLSGYGWVDKEKGVVRIPIERAMEMFAQQQSAAQRPRK